MENNEKAKFENCGINEDVFPCMGKCCLKNDAGFMLSYTVSCPYCEISTSLPDAASLNTATIMECKRFGYGRRVTK